MIHCTQAGAMGIRTAGAGASAPMMLRTVCAARRDCASGVSERADGSETSTASAEESSFLTAVVSGGRQAGHDGDDHFLRVQNGGAAVCRQGDAAVFIQRNGAFAAQKKGVSRNDSDITGFQVQGIQSGHQRKSGNDIPAPADEKRRGDPVFRSWGKQLVIFHDGSQGGG